ncbi:MAG: hypothetical protein ABI884_01985 [Gemmatimonadota bacterium]
MTPARWQLLAFQIVSLLGFVILIAFLVSAGPLAAHWHPRALMRTLTISCTLGLVGLIASAWHMRRFPMLRNTESAMIFVCGMALTAVQIIAIWTVVLPTVGY